MNQKKIENYADLVLQRGVGLTAGDILVIEDPSVTQIEFLRILTKKAYELGAKDVVIHFADQELTKIRLENAALSRAAIMATKKLASCVLLMRAQTAFRQYRQIE